MLIKEINSLRNLLKDAKVNHIFFKGAELLDKKIQQRIKEYNYCKTFNTAPYPSLSQTPAKVVDDFLEIEYIMNNIKREQNG